MRNIPACAGKTTPNRGCTPQSTEHPRVRGENHRKAQGLTTPYGTSPRARGKLYLAEDKQQEFRNIPACAGKTLVGKMGSVFDEEHPRVRGENSSRVSSWVKISGTSPRARGKPYDYKDAGQTIRNIPACAGKTPVAPVFCLCF